MLTGCYPGGAVYLGKNENLKSTRIISELEKKHVLTITEGPGFNNDKIVMPDKSKPQKNELEKALRTGESPPRLLLQTVIDEALADRPSMGDFADRLDAAGVTVRPNIASTGRLNGLTFDLNNLTFSGSKLGKKYSWKKLQKRIDYQPERDNPLLQKLKSQAQKNDEDKTSAEANTVTEPAAPATSPNSPGAGPGNERDYKQNRSISVYTSTNSPSHGAGGREDESLSSHFDSDTDNHHSLPSHDAGDTKILDEDKRMNKENNEQPVHQLVQDHTKDVENDIYGLQKRRHREDDEMRLRKKKHEEATTSGRKRNPSSVSSAERQRFKKTLDLAFEQKGNEYYYKGSDRLAFVDEGEKIVGTGLFNADGTPNRSAFKAMAQASQIKFGDEFNISGSDAYKREMWLQAAMIGCSASGYEPKYDDFAELKKRRIDYYSRYKRKPVALHPSLEKGMERFERDNAEARAKLSPNQKVTVQPSKGVKSQLNAWRAKREKQPSQGRGLAPKLPKPN